jgi:hypothetical protein
MQTPQTGETPGTLMQSLYDTDFYAWTQEQAKLLRHQQWSQLDLPNLIEEIESLGKTTTCRIKKSFEGFNWTSFKMGISNRTT